MREGEDEIGWMLSESPAKYPEESNMYILRKTQS
jgi:hypothetical protein